MSPLTSGNTTPSQGVVPGTPVSDPADVMTEPTQKHSLDLSLPQVVAGAVAAAAATVLSSRLGLVGTVLGAVFASIVSAVVTASVSGWWHRAHEASRTARDWVPQRVRGLVVGGVPHRGRAGHPGPAAGHLRRPLAGRGRPHPRLNHPKTTTAARTTATASAMASRGAREASRSSSW